MAHGPQRRPPRIAPDRPDIWLKSIAEGKAGRTQVAGEHMVVQIQQSRSLAAKRSGQFPDLARATHGGRSCLRRQVQCHARWCRSSVPPFSRAASATSSAAWNGRISGHARKHADASALPPRPFPTLRFFEQFGRRQHLHHCRYIALHARAHDAAGNQVQSRLDAIDDQCALHCGRPGSEPHLANSVSQSTSFCFAFVAPLRRRRRRCVLWLHSF